MKRWLILSVTLLIPALAIAGVLVFREKYYAWVTLCAVVIACLPLFISLERKEHTATELTVLAALIALSAAGRFVFAWLPGFKPITAMTIIAAISLGSEAGFAVGALSAVVSNFYFGQGPWTAFQMFAWGFIGMIAGLLGAKRRNLLIVCILGALSGVFYSLTMDVLTVLWADNSFNLARYAALVVAALPITAEYAVSNVIFLLILTRPIGDKLERIKIKYGLFNKKGGNVS